MQKQDTSSNSRKLQRITKEAEILSLMEESHKTKEWIKKQIKKKSLKIPIKLSMNSFQILKSCPDDFLDYLLDALKGHDIDDIGDINAFTRTFFWFFTDIVAGSNPTIPTKEQARKVVVLNELIQRTEIFQNRDPNSTVILPTGDGMAIGFSDSPEYPLRLSIQLHKILNKYNKTKKRKDDKVLLRIGIDIGPVYIIKDLNGQDNVWGPGIILTRRVMDLAGDQNIFCSSRFAEDVRVLSPEYKEIMHPIGDYSIKHGEQLNIFNIYGEGFGEKSTPRKKKILQKQETFEQELKSKTEFLFNTIGIDLKVTDPKTMMVHHTWRWNLVNLSNSPKDQVFYYLDGDTPKDFADMNVRVYDESGLEADILSLTENKPTHKEFTVKLKKPIKPRQRKRFVTIEYDWEEPERTFSYKIPTNCKEFSYNFQIPKGVEIKSRILKVDTELGYKWNAEPPATIKYLKDMTQIIWQGKNLKAFDAYTFDW
ncbi:MAG: hypothetical protein K5790_06580 [Nitrosopumilus sp.]|uniref:hypothetical protein n=1 Tax=Nitrosopumilus sp. TaxID=2024843 RepID=UPI00247CD51B|nr:hypothetical protein [Nitrosopumilus sp.]MCV0392943.1 hypothetical protein [Nitrosopumilus sp.]